MSGVRLPLAPGADLTAARLPLPPAARHYLVEVRRLPAGAALCLFSSGAEVDAVLEQVDGEWSARTTSPPRRGRAGADLTLCYGLPKGDKLDRVVRQATELGVGTIRLLATRRSVVRLEGDRAARRVERLERIAEEAARQCGRADQPTLVAPASVAEVVDALRQHTLWVLHPEDGVPLEQAPALAPLAVFVGPEGGFDPAELGALADATRVSLGALVLRTETAAPIACALALHRLGVL